MSGDLRGMVERILRARVYDVARETPLESAPRLSARLGERVLLKREDLPSVFSFKLRGAYNRMASLPRDRAERGVVAASAGNHAQGVALAAARLDLHATIVMPRTTPRIKVESVVSLTVVSAARLVAPDHRRHWDEFCTSGLEACDLRDRGSAV